MATLTTGSNFNNDQANGYVVADGFSGPAGAAASFPNGTTTSGPQVDTPTVVVTAGTSLGTATVIPPTAVLVHATSAASTAGMKLPSLASVKPGYAVTLLALVGHSYKVYARATGQKINAATTATTAFVMATVRPATFYAVDATHWQVVKGS